VRYLSTTTQAITPSQGTVSWSTLDSNVQGDLGVMFKNRIINGNMVIDQRNAGASVTPNNTYTLDRWTTTNTQTGKFTIQQNAGSVTPPAGFTNYLGVTSSSAYSVLNGDAFLVLQAIEGFNTADLGFGTANAKTVTLSFQAYSSLTGTFGGALINSANNRSYPFSYTVSSANTWTTVNVTIPGDTTGTWVGATNGIGLIVRFGLGSGAAFTGTAGAWASANIVQPTGSVSVVGTNGATWYITGVQLEVGTQATTFTTAGGSYGAELVLCQRYCFVEESTAQYRWFATGGWIGNSTTAYYGRAMPVNMRTSPSLTISSGTSFAVDGTAFTATTALTDQAISTPTMARMFATVASGLTAGQSAGLSSNSTSRLTITYSAEL
jgi:hypothetical protein